MFPRVLGSRAAGAMVLAALLMSFASLSLAQRALTVQMKLDLPGGRPVELYADSYALVIGAAAYTNGWPRLGGVPGDVRAVAATLREVGFKVTEVLDPTLAQLDAALRRFIGEEGQNPNHRLLIYFAGHGHTLTSAAGGQLGYIVPVDAPVPGERNAGAFKAAAMSMESIENYAKQIDAKHALFVFDSCFSGTFFKMRAAPESITLKTTQPVRQFITAGSANQQVPDVSVFRQQFLAGITGEADLNGDGYVTGSELGMFLEDKVTNYSRQTQTPQYGKIRDPSLDKGDFVFALATATARSDAPAAASAAIDPVSVELHFWDQVKDSKSADELNAYLEHYPKGRYASLARARLKAIDIKPAQATASAVFVLQQHASVLPPPTGPGAGFRDCETCPEMVMIPPGSFTMGSPESEPGRQANEGPQHTVTIARPFAAGKYEVTFDEWDACVLEKGCSHVPGDSGWGRGRRPVINVSWNDAKQYVAWLSRKTGKAYRLLSEAEWEYVARAGTSTAFHTGASIAPQQANYDTRMTYAGSPTASDPGKTVPVGSYPPNAFGLHDVHGNVWEWVEDCKNPGYGGAPSDGSAWTAGACWMRELRGGSWRGFPSDARSANRQENGSIFRYNHSGLRVARTN